MGAHHLEVLVHAVPKKLDLPSHLRGFVVFLQYNAQGGHPRLYSLEADYLPAKLNNPSTITVVFYKTMKYVSCEFYSGGTQY